MREVSALEHVLTGHEGQTPQESRDSRPMSRMQHEYDQIISDNSGQGAFGVATAMQAEVCDRNVGPHPIILHGNTMPPLVRLVRGRENAFTEF